MIYRPLRESAHDLKCKESHIYGAQKSVGKKITVAADTAGGAVAATTLETKKRKPPSVKLKVAKSAKTEVPAWDDSDDDSTEMVVETGGGMSKTQLNPYLCRAVSHSHIFLSPVAHSHISISLQDLPMHEKASQYP